MTSPLTYGANEERRDDSPGSGVFFLVPGEDLRWSLSGEVMEGIKVQRAMPTTVYGLSVQAYSRFRLRQLFLEFADGTRRPVSTSHALTILPMSGFDGGEIVVTKIHRPRIDLALMMRYLRQWILSEPSRILHMIEDGNRLRRQVEIDTLEGTHVVAATLGATFSVEQLETDLEFWQQQDLQPYLTLCPSLENSVFDFDIKSISMHRWLHAQVLGAYHELALAHPEVEVDPKENLAIQDRE